MTPEQLEERLLAIEAAIIAIIRSMTKDKDKADAAQEQVQKILDSWKKEVSWADRIDGEDKI